VIGLALDQQVPVQKHFADPMTSGSGWAISMPVALPGWTRASSRPYSSSGPPSIVSGGDGPPSPGIVPGNRPRVWGDARQIWESAPDAASLTKRLAALPGFGEMKVATMMAILAKRLGVKPAAGSHRSHAIRHSATSTRQPPWRSTSSRKGFTRQRFAPPRPSSGRDEPLRPVQASLGSGITSQRPGR